MGKLSLIGQKIGNYVIKSVIGRGDVAKVYLAEHPHLGRQVAVKVLAPHLALQPTLVARFEREARTAALLQHPNIIEIIDFGRLEDGSPYYTMELLEGRELRHVMRDKRQWSAWEVLPYIKQICAALQEAHEHNMVHRDLKPDNIFVLEGEPLRLKILDFGIAKLLEGDDASLTTTGTLLGNPTFTAPEQAAGATNAICKQTDIYSLGVILYWMLSGAPPFESKITETLIDQHIEVPPTPLLTRCPSVPPDVARLVHRCLEKEPGKRPATARQASRDFEDALRNLDPDAVDTLEDELQAASGADQEAGDEGPPGGEMSQNLMAFLGIDEEEDTGSAGDAIPDGNTSGHQGAPRLEPRIPAPPSSGGAVALPAPVKPAPPRKAPAPVLPPRIPAPAPGQPPASEPLDLPPPMAAPNQPPASEPLDLPAPMAAQKVEPATNPPAEVPEVHPEQPPEPVAPAAPLEAADSQSTDILSLDELYSETSLEAPGPDAVDEDQLDDLPTRAALPLLGASSFPPGAQTSEQNDEDLERPTVRDIPLIGDAEADDEAVQTAVLGLIGDVGPEDDASRAAVLGLNGAARPEDDAGTTAVLGLIGDTGPEDDASRAAVLGLIGDEDD